jgi:hypothetical protein
LGLVGVKLSSTWVVRSDITKTMIVLGKIHAIQRCRSSRWRQVGVPIGVLGGNPDSETRWLGEFDLDVPLVLGGGLPVPWAGKVRGSGAPGLRQGL